MKIEDQIQLHSERAMIELDRAFDADCIQAARAHFELSELHLDRMRILQQKQAQVPQH